MPPRRRERARVYVCRDPETLAALEADGLLRRVDGIPRTTPRWQRAMMRAAARLYAAGDKRDDLRIPITIALLEVYGPETRDEELLARIEIILPIEMRELQPQQLQQRPQGGRT